MTFLGKLLVFLNVLLATALLAWALSLYTNRVDWPAAEYRGKYDKADEFREKKLAALPGDFAKAIAAANLQYADARLAVGDAERQLAARLAAWQQKLALAGLDKGGKFFELVRPGAKAGTPLSDRLDLATEADAAVTKVTRKDGTAAPLRGLAELEREWKGLTQATTAEKLRYKTLGDDLAKIDDEVRDANVAIGRYRVALAQWADEKATLADVRVNADAQLITLLKRNDQLRERLKSFGVTSARR
jgi:hypothetical protein